jgi:hypothetical protein
LNIILLIYLFIVYNNAFSLQNFKGDKTVVLIDKSNAGREKWIQVLKCVLQPAFFSRTWQKKITSEINQYLMDDEDDWDCYYIHELNVLNERFQSEIVNDSEQNIEYMVCV